MIFFASYLWITISVAQFYDLATDLNDPIVHCYNDTECILEDREKPYCYAGECSDMCPPGYTKSNHGQEPKFKCSCDTKNHFVIDGYFGGIWTDLNIPKCKCNSTWIPFCVVTVWSEGIGYTEGLVPKGFPPNCKEDTVKLPHIVSRFALIVMIASSLIFMIVNWQSCSGIIYDFHRYITIYIISTIPLMYFVQSVSPFRAGFTRSMAFGVIIHNAAEWNLLIRLQYGKTMSSRAQANLCVMCYYIILLIAIIFLPLPLLLFVGMVQGGFLDWAFVLFTCVGGRTIKKDKENTEPLSRVCFPTERANFQWGFGAAATFHLMTVEILFTGFVQNNSELIGAGACLLVPMFLIYTCWASREDFVTRCFGPGLLMNYTKEEGKTPNFSLQPFTHTTNRADLSWQAFIGSRYPTFKNEEVVLLEAELDDTKSVSNPIGIKIEDCENFKFGIDDEVHKCCCGGILFKWIPIYWVAALAAITTNGLIIFFWPQNHSGCAEGYDYGIW